MKLPQGNPFAHTISLICFTLAFCVIAFESNQFLEKQLVQTKDLRLKKQVLEGKNKHLQTLKMLGQSLETIRSTIVEKMSTPMSVEYLKKNLEKKVANSQDTNFKFMNFTIQSSTSQEMSQGLIQDTLILSWDSYHDRDLEDMFLLLNQTYPGIFVLNTFTMKKINPISKEVIFDVATGMAHPFFTTHVTLVWIHKEPLL